MLKRKNNDRIKQSTVKTNEEYEFKDDFNVHSFNPPPRNSSVLVTIDDSLYIHDRNIDHYPNQQSKSVQFQTLKSSCGESWNQASQNIKQTEMNSKDDIRVGQSFKNTIETECHRDDSSRTEKSEVSEAMNANTDNSSLMQQLEVKPIVVEQLPSSTLTFPSDSTLNRESSYLSDLILSMRKSITRLFKCQFQLSKCNDENENALLIESHTKELNEMINFANILDSRQQFYIEKLLFYSQHLRQKDILLMKNGKREEFEVKRLRRLVDNMKYRCHNIIQAIQDELLLYEKQKSTHSENYDFKAVLQRLLGTFTNTDPEIKKQQLQKQLDDDSIVNNRYNKLEMTNAKSIFESNTIHTRDFDEQIIEIIKSKLSEAEFRRFGELSKREENTAEQVDQEFNSSMEKNNLMSSASSKNSENMEGKVELDLHSVSIQTDDAILQFLDDVKNDKIAIIHDMACQTEIHDSAYGNINNEKSQPALIGGIDIEQISNHATIPTPHPQQALLETSQRECNLSENVHKLIKNNQVGKKRSTSKKLEGNKIYNDKKVNIRRITNDQKIKKKGEHSTGSQTQNGDIQNESHKQKGNVKASITKNCKIIELISRNDISSDNLEGWNHSVDYTSDAIIDSDENIHTFDSNSNMSENTTNLQAEAENVNSRRLRNIKNNQDLPSPHNDEASTNQILERGENGDFEITSTQQELLHKSDKSKELIDIKKEDLNIEITVTTDDISKGNQSIDDPSSVSLSTDDFFVDNYLETRNEEIFSSWSEEHARLSLLEQDIAENLRSESSISNHSIASKKSLKNEKKLVFSEIQLNRMLEKLINDVSEGNKKKEAKSLALLEGIYEKISSCLHRQNLKQTEEEMKKDQHNRYQESIKSNTKILEKKTEKNDIGLTVTPLSSRRDSTSQFTRNSKRKDKSKTNDTTSLYQEKKLYPTKTLVFSIEHKDSAQRKYSTSHHEESSHINSPTELIESEQQPILEYSTPQLTSVNLTFDDFHQDSPVSHKFAESHYSSPRLHEKLSSKLDSQIHAEKSHTNGSTDSPRNEGPIRNFHLKKLACNSDISPSTEQQPHEKLPREDATIQFAFHHTGISSLRRPKYVYMTTDKEDIDSAVTEYSSIDIQEENTNWNFPIIEAENGSAPLKNTPRYLLPSNSDQNDSDIFDDSSQMDDICREDTLQSTMQSSMNSKQIDIIKEDEFEIVPKISIPKVTTNSRTYTTNRTASNHETLHTMVEKNSNRKKNGQSTLPVHIRPNPPQENVKRFGVDSLRYFKYDTVEDLPSVCKELPVHTITFSDQQRRTAPLHPRRHSIPQVPKCETDHVDPDTALRKRYLQFSGKEKLFIDTYKIKRNSFSNSPKTPHTPSMLPTIGISNSLLRGT